MALKTLSRIVSLTISLLIAASTATAQAPNVPAARLHHSGVYDETRENSWYTAATHGIKEPRNSMMSGDGMAPRGSWSATQVSARSWRRLPLIQNGNER
jgi:hypothetical protein